MCISVEGSDVGYGERNVTEQVRESILVVNR